MAGRPDRVGWVVQRRETGSRRPAQDRGGRDEHSEASARSEESGQGGDQGSLGPADPRSGSAPLQHSELVAQNEDLDLLGGVGSGAQHHSAESLEDRR